MNREIITLYITIIFKDKELDKLLDRIYECKNTDEFIIQYVNETVLLYNTTNDLYLTWYKLNHLGRCFLTNIKDITELNIFLKDLKDSIDWRVKNYE